MIVVSSYFAHLHASKCLSTTQTGLVTDRKGHPYLTMDANNPPYLLNLVLLKETVKSSRPLSNLSSTAQVLWQTEG